MRCQAEEGPACAEDPSPSLGPGREGVALSTGWGVEGRGGRKSECWGPDRQEPHCLGMCPRDQWVVISPGASAEEEVVAKRLRPA